MARPRFGSGLPRSSWALRWSEGAGRRSSARRRRARPRSSSTSSCRNEDGVPKQAVVTEGKTEATPCNLTARIWSESAQAGYDGSKTWYIEFDDNIVHRVQVNLLDGPTVSGVFAPPSPEITAEKADFAFS